MGFDVEFSSIFITCYEVCFSMTFKFAVSKYESVANSVEIHRQFSFHRCIQTDRHTFIQTLFGKKPFQSSNDLKTDIFTKISKYSEYFTFLILQYSLCENNITQQFTNVNITRHKIQIITFQLIRFASRSMGSQALCLGQI